MNLIDTLKNLASGLGMFGRDKAAHGQFTLDLIDRVTLETMYRGDWIARKVVDVPAEDMLREGRSWKADEKAIEAIEAEEKRLGVRAKMRLAVGWARLYGGAGLILGDGDADTTKPLDVAKMKEGGLTYLAVLPRHRLTVSELDWEPDSPFFMGPKSYRLNTPGGPNSNADLHPSRVIQFIGNAIPDVENAGDALGWGDSVLQATAETIRNAAATNNSLATLIEEAKVDVFKIPGLMASVGTAEYRERMLTRWTLASTMKATNAALLIDKDEEWEQKQVKFEGLPEVLRVFLEVVAGAADIPVTRLLGVSAKGLNATGEGDQKNYYDKIRGLQGDMLDPAYERLDPFLFASATGQPMPDDAFYEHNPLTQVDDETAAKIAKLKAEVAQIIGDSGLLPLDALAKAVQNALIEDGTFPGIEAALAEAKMKLGESLVDPNAPDPIELIEAEAAARQPANDPGAPRPVTVNAKTGSRDAKVHRLGDTAAKDFKPSPLYVSRRVLNAKAIIDHFKGQGFESLLDPADMHVTVTFSRAPVDWFAMGSAWSDDSDGKLRVAPGGPRAVEPLGKAAAVLFFAAESLTWRHDAMIERGASWDYDEFAPHLTLTYAPVPDLKGVEPWKGEIVLGPEIFEAIDDDWTDRIEEA